MTCMRCQGLMVKDNLVDLQESYLPMWMCGWRCVACGNIVDPLINRNRMIQRSGTMGLLKQDVRVPAFARQAKAA